MCLHTHIYGSPSDWLLRVTPALTENHLRLSCVEASRGQYGGMCTLKVTTSNSCWFDIISTVVLNYRGYAHFIKCGLMPEEKHLH